MGVDRTTDLTTEELKELIEGSFQTMSDRIRTLATDLSSTKEYCEKALVDHKQAMIINELKDLGQKINNFSGRLSVIEAKLTPEPED